MALSRTGLAVLAALIAASPQAAFSQSQPPTLLAVSVDGELPGFSARDAASYVAREMTAAGVATWRFEAAIGSAPPNRIEWHIIPDPYAGSSVRQFFPIPQVQKTFGARHRISVEARLYLDGAYQTLLFDQATVQGGTTDDELAAFITDMTKELLGPQGALQAIDMTPAAAP